ncbi:hypothetical protein [Pseudoalteromonas phenolica]|uniref:Uncharacterized protein n=1 Tax=Pseudoalteromonas phenolica TaxID=161398 RepID=A0A0S2K8G0_9GAMM|nr:hypothetical protein [Pseudoalteromonas phenolica]ALO44292.1 hypothetical protein PP2015_3823 [Pseudoalteromonas phenolica]MBE0357290.1 hypothetical protein [Pseudoalteromonas phenolica O-BC30]RXE92122.1 hypothetical protein D9981_21895 [Pseudoalteromonas phenolica O-BC30]
MKFSELKVSDKSLMGLVLSLTGLLLIGHFSIEEPVLPDYLVICMAILLAGQCYRFHPKYKQDNALTNQIRRDDDVLKIKNKSLHTVISTQKSQSIKIARISKVTVIDEGLSIIIDGNGAGFDFFLNDNAKDIAEHLKALLSPQEQAKIEFEVIS